MKIQAIIDAVTSALEDIQPCHSGTGPSHETTNVVRARTTLKNLIAAIEIVSAEELRGRPVGSTETRLPTSLVDYDEGTLRKVYLGLWQEGIYGQKAVDVVTALQNVGILFRERS